MKKVIIAGFIALMLVVGVVATPNTANAATYYQYNGRIISADELRIILINQIQILLAQLDRIENNNSNNGQSYGNSDVDVETLSAKSVENDRAQLMGEVDLNDEDEARVWFEYGTSRSLGRSTGQATIDDNDPTRFMYSLRGLSSFRTYYYRAMAEDERGRDTAGEIRTFRTDGSNDWDDDRNDDDRDDEDFDNDEPDVETNDADNVSDTSATIYGEVEMNDYEEGLAFFAYGQDEDLVADIADDYDSFDDIDEDGDDLQVIEVEDGLDEGDDWSGYARIVGLEEDTEYYFAICLQFEDDNGEEMILCGSVEDFETDY